MALVESELDEELEDTAKSIHHISKVFFYVKRPDDLEQMCIADSATFYEDREILSSIDKFVIFYFKQNNGCKRHFR